MALDAEMLALEQRIVEAAAGDWLRSLEALKIAVAMESPDVAAMLLALVAPQISPVALAGLTEAAHLAAVDALATIQANPDLSDAAQAAAAAAMPQPITTVTPSGQVVDAAGVSAKVFGEGSAQHLTALERAAQAAGVPLSITDAVRQLDPAAQGALSQALRLKAAGASAGEYTAPLFGHAIAAKRTLVDGVNGAASEATTSMAHAVELPLVWVAERDACVRCLAHQGHVIRAGESFPAGLTFGPYVYEDATSSCPLHGHCRCKLEILHHQAYADALKREAVRSVLRGYSLPSESMGVRVKAAARLLDNGVDAPKSVKAVAARAVKAGGFGTREVPPYIKPQPRRPGGPATPPPPPATPPKPPAPPTPKTPKTPTDPAKAKADAARKAQDAARKAAEDAAKAQAEFDRIQREATVAKAKRAAEKQAADDAAKAKAEREYQDRKAAREAAAAKVAKAIADRAETDRYYAERKAAMLAKLEVGKVAELARLAETAKGTGLAALKRKTGPLLGMTADAGAVNPGRNITGKLYKVNCTNCTAAVELRARGLDVVAQGRPSGKGRPQAEFDRAWRDADGNVRPASQVGDKARLEEHIAGWPDGARGAVMVQWQHGGGHIFNVEKRDGVAVFHEGQTPDKTSAEVAEYFAPGQIKRGQLWVNRLDDLTPTDELLDYVEDHDAKAVASLAKRAAVVDEKKRLGTIEYTRLGDEYQAMVTKFKALSAAGDHSASITMQFEANRKYAEYKKAFDKVKRL